MDHFSYLRFIDILKGDKLKPLNPAEQFATAFRKGDVATALKIFDENRLDENNLYVFPSISSYGNICYALLESSLEWYHRAKDNLIAKNRMEILKQILANEKYTSIDSTPSLLMRAIDLYNLDVISILLARKNHTKAINTIRYRDFSLPYSSMNTHNMEETAFTFAISYAKQNANLEPLVLLLKSGKVDMSLDVDGMTQLQHLQRNKALIASSIETRLAAWKPDTQKLAALKEKAKLATKVERPALGAMPIGSQARQEYFEKNQAWGAALDDIVNYENAIKQFQSQQKIYEAESAKLRALFSVISTAANGKSDINPQASDIVK